MLHVYPESANTAYRCSCLSPTCTDFGGAGIFKIGTPMVPGEFLMLEETSWRTGSTGRGGTPRPQQQTKGDADIQEVALRRAEERLQECE